MDILKNDDIIYHIGNQLVKYKSPNLILLFRMVCKFYNTTHLKSCQQLAKIEYFIQEFKNATEKKSLYHIVGFYPLNEIIPILVRSCDTIYTDDAINYLINNNMIEYTDDIANCLIKIDNNNLDTNKENIIKKAIWAIKKFKAYKYIDLIAKYLNNKNISDENNIIIDCLIILTLTDLGLNNVRIKEQYLPIIANLFKTNHNNNPLLLISIINSIGKLGDMTYLSKLNMIYRYSNEYCNPIINISNCRQLIEWEKLGFIIKYNKAKIEMNINESYNIAKKNIKMS